MGAAVVAGGHQPPVPFLAFTVQATRSGELVFTWTDEAGRSQTASAAVIVR